MYESFLGEAGQPKTHGMDWTPFFTKEYYQRKVPIWGGMDDAGLLGEAGSQTPGLGRAALIGLVIGLLLGGLAALLRSVFTRAREV